MIRTQYNATRPQLAGTAREAPDEATLGPLGVGTPAGGGRHPRRPGPQPAERFRTPAFHNVIRSRPSAGLREGKECSESERRCPILRLLHPRAGQDHKLPGKRPDRLVWYASVRPSWKDHEVTGRCLPNVPLQGIDQEWWKAVKGSNI